MTLTPEPIINKKTLQISYLPVESAAMLADDPTVMALIGFSNSASSSQPGGPQITVGLEQLNTPEWVEVWRTKHLVSWQQKGGISFCMVGDMLFGHMILDESSSSNLEALSEKAYRSLIDLTAEQGYSNLIRIWNYLPNINQQQNQQERYQVFCAGRHRACAQLNDFQSRLPAATAIGTHSAGFLVYFLAGKTAGIQVENPRQVSAFYYPAQYGPKSPSFSRAMLKEWSDQSDLYISGTASVVGHETYHVDDKIGQLKESACNIKQLLQEAKGPQKLHLIKVYLRERGDLSEIDRQIDRLFDSEIPRIYLQADICRQDLLLEIDGYATTP